MSQQNQELSWNEYKSRILKDVAPRKQQFVSMALENQRNFISGKMINENASSLPGNPSVGTSNISIIPKMTIPMIRRILPATIASDLVGIQPMSGPVGLVSSLRYTFAGKPQTTYTDNEQIYAADKDLNNAYGNTPDGWGNPVTGLEPAYSETWTDQTFMFGDEMFGTSYKKPGPADNPYDTTYNRLMKRFYSGGYIHDAASAKGTLSGYGAPTDNGGGRDNPNSWYGQDLTFNGVDPAAVFDSLEGRLGNQVGLEVLRETVSALTRKLSAKWTPEAQQDLKAMNGLDMEDELTTAISNEIMQDIDNEITSDLLALPDVSNVSVFDLQHPLPGFAPTFLGDMYANLGPQILNIANNIAKRTRRGPANWLVCAPQVVTVLQSAAKSIFAPAITGTFDAPDNNRLVGTLNNQMKVYSYIWFDNNTNPSAPGVDPLLMGYKGSKEMDAGYYYCPYVPLIATPTVMDPYTGEMVVSFMTRYGKVQLTNHKTSLANSPDYYGKICLKGISFG